MHSGKKWCSALCLKGQCHKDLTFSSGVLVLHLIIEISERSFTQHFDDSMSSFSSEKRIKFYILIYAVQGDKM